MFIIKSISEYLQELSDLKVNELLNVICFIITIIASVYSSWLFSTSQFKKIRYKKEERFLTRYKRISKLSGEFTNKMFNHYLKKYNSDLAGKTEDEKENSGLIIHKDWEIKETVTKLIPFRNIEKPFLSRSFCQQKQAYPKHIYYADTGLSHLGEDF